MKKIFISSFILIMVMPLATGAYGQMSSANYTITTSVISGGGAAMTSDSGTYEMLGTLGQPSPLEPYPPAVSDGLYELYPGFWYTLGAGVATCDLPAFAAAFGSVFGDAHYSMTCDDEPDDDLDGSDLASFVFSLP